MLKRLKSASFLGQILDLTSGSALAQLILIASAPILTHLFPPGAFGVVATYTSIVAILSIAACLRYELAIVIPESNEDAATLFVSCILLSLFSGLLCLFLIFFFSFSGASGKIMEPMGYFIWLIPFAVIVNGLHQALNYWNIRKSRFKTIAKGKVLTQSTNTATGISLALVGVATGGALVVSNTLGHVLNLTYIVSSLRKSDFVYFRHAITSGQIKSTLRQYQNFPIYSIPSGLFNTTSTLLPIIGLGYFFSPMVVGLYAFTMRILLAPISLIGGAISQALTLRIARNQEGKSISDFVQNIYTSLLSISIFPAVFLVMLGEEVFNIAFGSKWELAGTFAQLIAPWTMIWFIVSPLSVLFEVLEKQKLGTIHQLGILMARILGLSIGALIHSAEMTIILLSGFGSIALFGMLTSIANIAGLKFSKMIKSSLPWVGLSLCLAIVIRAFESLTSDRWLLIILGLLATGLFTTVSVLRLKPLRKEFLKR